MPWSSYKHPPDTLQTKTEIGNGRRTTYFVHVVFAHALDALQLIASFTVDAFDAGASIFGFGFGQFDQLITEARPRTHQQQDGHKPTVCEAEHRPNFFGSFGELNEDALAQVRGIATFLCGTQFFATGFDSRNDVFGDGRVVRGELKGIE